jgi:hypothetical protein
MKKIFIIILSLFLCPNFLISQEKPKADNMKKNAGINKNKKAKSSKTKKNKSTNKKKKGYLLPKKSTETYKFTSKDSVNKKNKKDSTQLYKEKAGNKPFDSYKFDKYGNPIIDKNKNKKIDNSKKQ